jgi:hypothetical protein
VATLSLPEALAAGEPLGEALPEALAAGEPLREALPEKVSKKPPVGMDGCPRMCK